jgi:hypothetical protein
VTRFTTHTRLGNLLDQIVPSTLVDNWSDHVWESEIHNTVAL